VHGHALVEVETPDRSVTRTNWYRDSFSKTRPSPPRTAPGGSASMSATAAAATTQRRPRSSDPESTSTAAEASIVRCVPISGISTSAGRNVPRSEPAVESA
jgi:hypothetical protein